MHVSSLIVLVAGAASAVAQYPVESVTSSAGTTTATSYLTATVTITKCNPTNTACPLYSSSSSSTSSSVSTPPAYPTSSVVLNTTSSAVPSSTWYPISKNSTVSAGPTAYPNVSSSYVVPTTYATQTSLIPTTAAATPSYPASTSAPAVPASGAGIVSVQSGLLMGVLAMGAAFFA
ncbi:hypothetical protein F4805DRAFT_422548 [Annulohypoxylon moriforme]|nr:hypothetical protein F4805DRAFT_422548 [Annulohypoxylon moriforme]